MTTIRIRKRLVLKMMLSGETMKWVNSYIMWAVTDYDTNPNKTNRQRLNNDFTIKKQN
jgi:hypothetical protein